MYRIRLASGDETTFDSSEAFTAAVHDGTINSYCRIFHQRTEQWLPVVRHPHYHAAQQAGDPAATAAPAPMPASEPAAPSAVPRQATPRPRFVGRAAEGPPAATPTPATGQPSTTDLAELDKILELLEPTAEPTAAAPAAESVAPPAPAAPAPAPGPRPKSKEIEWVYVPESSFARKAEAVRTESAAPASAPLPERAPMPAPWPRIESTAAGIPEAVAPPVVAMPQPEAPRYTPPTPVAYTPPTTLDIEIPSFERETESAPVTLLEAEESAPAAYRATVPLAELPMSAPRRSSRAVVFGVVALLGTGLSVMAWAPWKSRDASALAAQPAASSEVATSTAGATPTIRSIPEPRAEQVAGLGADAAVPAGTLRAGESALAAVPAAQPLIPTVAPLDLAALPTRVGGAAPAGGKLPISRADLARNYAASHAAARADLEAQLTEAGFERLFEPARIGSTEGLLDSRRSVASAGRIVRAHLARAAAIEQAYGDTLGMVGRKLGIASENLRAWDVRTTQGETAETTRLTETMLAQVDRLYGLLLAEDGHYALQNGAIVFGDSGAAARYGELRGWLAQRASAPPAGAVAAQQIARAISAAKLPVERVSP